jgi:sugar/nucleoside kinase (ribokinase family)
MSSLLVIGVASRDVLHFGEQTVHTAGGAGLYTALAARRADAQVTLFAPRPHPLPDRLAPFAGRINWIGPIVPPEAMTQLEIAHHGGGKATLLNADWGAEKELKTKDLPDDLSGFAFIHIAALSSARRQLEFLHVCRERGARRISVGTYARLVYGETENVRRLLQSADLFFMNENEANGLFGSMAGVRAQSGKLLFVTLAERGALVIEADRRTTVPAPAIREVDPTGAGDTFCGTTLAALAQGLEAVSAARLGVAQASAMIEHIGPTYLELH